MSAVYRKDGVNAAKTSSRGIGGRKRPRSDATMVIHPEEQARSKHELLGPWPLDDDDPGDAYSDISDDDTETEATQRHMLSTYREIIAALEKENSGGVILGSKISSIYTFDDGPKAVRGSHGLVQEAFGRKLVIVGFADRNLRPVKDSIGHTPPKKSFLTHCTFGVHRAESEKHTKILNAQRIHNSHNFATLMGYLFDHDVVAVIKLDNTPGMNGDLRRVGFLVPQWHLLEGDGFLVDDGIGVGKRGSYAGRCFYGKLEGFKEMIKDLAIQKEKSVPSSEEVMHDSSSSSSKTELTTNVTITDSNKTTETDVTMTEHRKGKTTQIVQNNKSELRSHEVENSQGKTDKEASVESADTTSLSSKNTSMSASKVAVPPMAATAYPGVQGSNMKSSKVVPPMAASVNPGMKALNAKGSVVVLPMAASAYPGMNASNIKSSVVVPSMAASVYPKMNSPNVKSSLMIPSMAASVYPGMKASNMKSSVMVPPMAASAYPGMNASNVKSSVVVPPMATSAYPGMQASNVKRSGVVHSMPAPALAETRSTMKTSNVKAPMIMPPPMKSTGSRFAMNSIPEQSTPVVAKQMKRTASYGKPGTFAACKSVSRNSTFNDFDQTRKDQFSLTKRSRNISFNDFGQTSKEYFPLKKKRSVHFKMSPTLSDNSLEKQSMSAGMNSVFVNGKLKLPGTPIASNTPLMNITQHKPSEGQVLALKGFVSRLSFIDVDDKPNSLDLTTKGNTRNQPIFSDLFSHDIAHSSCCILPSFRLCGPTVDKTSSDGYSRTMTVASTNASAAPRMVPTSKVAIPSMAASVFDADVDSMEGSMPQVQMSPPLNKSEAIKNLSSQSLWTASSMEKAPKTMKDNISTSFNVLVRSFVTKKVGGSSGGNTPSLVVTSCVTSFQAIYPNNLKTDSGDENMSEQGLVVSLPLFFQCQIGMTKNGVTTIVKLHSSGGTINGSFTNSSDSNLRKVELKIDMESLFQCMTEQAHFVTSKNTNPSAHFDDFERPKDRPNQSLATIKLMSNANQQVRKASSGALTLSTRHNSKVGRQVSSSKSQMRSSASFGKPGATAFESSSNMTFKGVTEQSKNGPKKVSSSRNNNDPFGLGLAGSGLFHSFLSTDRLFGDDKKPIQKISQGASNQVFTHTGMINKPRNPLINALNSKPVQHQSLASIKLLSMEENSRKKSTTALSLRKSRSVQVKNTAGSNGAKLLRSCTSFGKPGASSFKSVGNETFETYSTKLDNAIQPPKKRKVGTSVFMTTPVTRNDQVVQSWMLDDFVLFCEQNNHLSIREALRLFRVNERKKYETPVELTSNTVGIATKLCCTCKRSLSYVSDCDTGRAVKRVGL